MSDPSPDPAAEPASGGADTGHEAPPATQRPVLASEALKDDVAPVQPLARTARNISLLVGAVLAGLPLAERFGLPLGNTGQLQLALSLVLALLALGAGVLPRRYAQRAAVMLLVGVSSGALGALGFGPAAAAEEATGEWGLVVLIAAIGLPAALLFRARYRAFLAARLILGAALALSMPFAVHALLRTISAPALPLQVASGVAVGAVLLSLLGFMGGESTGAGNLMAAVVTIAIAAVLGTEALVDARGMAPIDQALRPLVSVGVFAATALVGALGLFGLLAWRFGPQARAANPRSRPAAEKRPRPSIGGWLSRR
jgi:hypothetical protein